MGKTYNGKEILPLSEELRHIAAAFAVMERVKSGYNLRFKTYHSRARFELYLQALICEDLNKHAAIRWATLGVQMHKEAAALRAIAGRARRWWIAPDTCKPMEHADKLRAILNEYFMLTETYYEASDEASE